MGKNEEPGPHFEPVGLSVDSEEEGESQGGLLSSVGLSTRNQRSEKEEERNDQNPCHSRGRETVRMTRAGRILKMPSRYGIGTEADSM